MKHAYTLSALLCLAMAISTGPAIAGQDTAGEQETTEQETTQAAPETRDARPRRRGPDLSEAAATLGITEEALENAMRASGGPPPNLAKVASELGIDEDTLKEALPPPPERRRRRS